MRVFPSAQPPKLQRSSAFPPPALGLLFVFLVACSMASGALADESPYGLYSNMKSYTESGDYSGFEFFLLPSNDGDYLLFQAAEGWPKKPLLLKATVGGYTTEDHNVLRFTHPQMGPFVGKIDGDLLHGEFKAMRYKVELIKGRSVWQ